MKIKMKKGKYILACVLAAAITVSTAVPALADSNAYCVSLGADLTSDEKATVLDLLDISGDEYKDHLITVTNEDEHKYLDDYLSSSVIGTKALSSVYVEEESEGYGIQVTTKHITYCTTGMYENALATAGLKNARVIVAAPFDISGTAALIGAMKAYSEMSGEPIEAEALDTANDELVTTGEVAEDIGNDDAESLIGAIKEAISAEDVSSDEDIDKIIDETAEKLNITLSDEDKEKIHELMKKIDDLDLDVDELQKQAQNIYSKLQDMGITEEKAQNFFSKIISWITGLFS